MMKTIGAKSAQLATISLSALNSEVPEVQCAEVNRLTKVCQSIGFFYLSDHGVSKDLRERLFLSSRNFFSLPEEEKQKYGQDAQLFTPKTLRGYVATGIESLNPGIDIDQKQTFELGNERPLIPGRLFTGPNVLPTDDVAPDFGKSNMELNKTIVKKIVPVLGRAFAIGLGLNETFFNDALTEEDMLVTQRISFYPPYSGSCGRHCDSGLFTVILQETQVDSSSLKIFANGVWQDVMAKEDLFIVNLGNMLQFWTNNRFISTPHCVVHSGSTSRISIPIFVYPRADAEMIPIGESEEKKIAGEVYYNDLIDVWERNNGIGNWAKVCSWKEGECTCWKCM